MATLSARHQFERDKANSLQQMLKLEKQRAVCLPHSPMHLKYFFYMFLFPPSSLASCSYPCIRAANKAPSCSWSVSMPIPPRPIRPSPHTLQPHAPCPQPPPPSFPFPIQNLPRPTRELALRPSRAPSTHRLLLLPRTFAQATRRATTRQARPAPLAIAPRRPRAKRPSVICARLPSWHPSGPILPQQNPPRPGLQPFPGPTETTP